MSTAYSSFPKAILVHNKKHRWGTCISFHNNSTLINLPSASKSLLDLIADNAQAHSLRAKVIWAKVTFLSTSSYPLSSHFILPPSFSRQLTPWLLYGTSKAHVCWLQGYVLGLWDGDWWAGGGQPVRPLPVLWPTIGTTAGPPPGSQPAAPVIGSLELICPAEPCKAPFVPSCRLDHAGDRHSSLDWLSVSQPVAIHIQAQTQAQPGCNEIVTWIPSQSEHGGKEVLWGKEGAGGREYRRGWFQQELGCSVNRAGSQQGHYLAPNLSSGTALKGCLCLGLMRKAQDAMSEGNNQRGPFITLAACAPGQGPPAHFCGDEIYDKPLSEAKSRQQSSNTHRPPGILWPP